jgi:hypothetical protein
VPNDPVQKDSLITQLRKYIFVLRGSKPSQVVQEQADNDSTITNLRQQVTLLQQQIQDLKSQDLKSQDLKNLIPIEGESGEISEVAVSG